jgi:hypothetical protein
MNTSLKWIKLMGAAVFIGVLVVVLLGYGPGPGAGPVGWAG